jgi:hypothetical protein
MLRQPGRQIRRNHIRPLHWIRHIINVPKPKSTPHSYTIEFVMDEMDNMADICCLYTLFYAFPKTNAGADGGGDVGGQEVFFVVIAEIFGWVFELDAEER